MCSWDSAPQPLTCSPEPSSTGSSWWAPSSVAPSVAEGPASSPSGWLGTAGAAVSAWLGCTSPGGWEVAVTWAVVAPAAEALWVVGSCVGSLGSGFTSFSRAVMSGLVSNTTDTSPSSGLPPAGRMGVEMAVASPPLGSGAVGPTDRSHVSFQGEADEGMSCKAPGAGPGAE